jgi:hypothetical protein
MFTRTRALALSALVAVSAIAGAPAAANAGDLKIKIQIGGGQAYGYGPGYGYGYGYGYRHCTPGKAIHKARSLGLHKVSVSRVGWKAVVVEGRKFGQKHTIAFGAAPHCPVKYWS